MAIWIVEGRPHSDSEWQPFLGHVFETEAGAMKGRRELVEARPEFEYRAAPYHQVSREDLEWAICHLGMYAHSEELERLREVIL